MLSFKHYQRRFPMLSTEKISGAFKAIIEEADKLKNKDLPDKVQKRIKTIISIAKHQSDIRNSPKGHCKAKKCDSSK
jgi:hypothetical protein